MTPVTGAGQLSWFAALVPKQRSTKSLFEAKFPDATITNVESALACLGITAIPFTSIAAPKSKVFATVVPLHSDLWKINYAAEVTD